MKKGSTKNKYYYHGSPVKDIKVLEPRVSNHKVANVYLSDTRENVLVYLSNDIKRVCDETGYTYDGYYNTWASYGFKDGKLEIQEYYPNATYETYKGISGYIYRVKDVKDIKAQDDIPHAYITQSKTVVDSAEYIEDAYEEIMKAVQAGKIYLLEYEDFMKEKGQWLEKTIIKEYKEATNPPYKHFLEVKFPEYIKKVKNEKETSN